ncbi:hypothetical protein LDENG_00132690 [Lucifuga dentata]|nr:hypothetical protein LDENG_00132690 [Lucifuga dentata]
MKCHICPILLLILTLGSGSAVANNRFFISAPSVFHVDVKEKVFVQTVQLNDPVTLYLEDQISGLVVSDKIETVCTNEEKTKVIELMINKEIMSRIPKSTRNEPYLLLVAESHGKRMMTRVLVSKHRGYIFIQTNQPIYNPTQTVSYRIFTLDHTMRPHEGVIQISVINAAGNRVMKSLKTAKGGILTDIFNIPDVSKMGTWKIIAHYEEDEANAASREFKVQKFVLPSFEVTIKMEQNYILMNAEQVNFTILAMYTYGEEVNGAYHCQVGVLKKDSVFSRKLTPVFIKGLELTGSVQQGNAEATLQIAELKKQLQSQLNTTLSDLQQSGEELFLRVFVTNIQSGELQESEVSLPFISNKYSIDLSRTRSFFIPGVPLDVMVIIRLPDGSPAVGVPVQIRVPVTSETSQFTTNQQGAVVAVYNIPTTDTITVDVSVDGLQKSKVIPRASSQTNNYLYLNIDHKLYSVGRSLVARYEVINGPKDGIIYYMVLSRGIIIKNGSLQPGISKQQTLDITRDMVPSFRLIGYYYSQNGDIIADSVWVDVKDECEIKVKVTTGQHKPGKKAEIKIDLNGERAKVALLAVDKAIYALNPHNKLTAKQVFSSMESYDLGCSYGGGSDPVSTINDAGLSFISQSQSEWRRGRCDLYHSRKRRSVDLQQEMRFLKSNFSNEQLQDCCVQGFSLIPMRRTCEDRAKRVSLMEVDPDCAKAFLKCCLEGENLRQKKRQEDASKGLGRTARISDIEEFFMYKADEYIRRIFPPSFIFKVYEINGEKSLPLFLPDSITNWEIQAVTLSPTTGFCVAEPATLKAFKEVFASLKLPHSVKKYEQISISPVIYNYGDESKQLAVHMTQIEGLCSPGSATTSTFVNITVAPRSSQFVSFSAVPMVSGSIPIKIRLYDIKDEMGKDAIEKILNVWTEGMEQRTEETRVIKLHGRNSDEIFLYDGKLPYETVPDSSSNIFISMEGEGFNQKRAKNLLSPEGVHSMIILPTGCLEQTMSKLTPTIVALRYLDMSEQWIELPAGARDVALDHIERGSMRILELKQPNKAYASWISVQYSTWMTSYVVKVLSLVAERQTVSFGQQGRRPLKTLKEEEISDPVSFLLSKQNDDGSFGDPNPVIHRGILEGKEHTASITAYITIALHRSLQFIKKEMRDNAQASISRATTYLMSQYQELQKPYAIAITAYCLSVCLPKGTDVSNVWTKLQAIGTIGIIQCSTNEETQNKQQVSDAITIETAAYALLTAVELGQTEWADNAACWLISQENFKGGFQSTQDTIMALEALSEYELKRTTSTFTNVTAEFTVEGKKDIIKVSLENKKDSVETDLKKLIGNRITVHLTGNGNATLKIVKVYHLLDPKDHCEQVSIKVTVVGKVQYTDRIMDMYGPDDYDDEYEEKVERVARSPIEWFDAPTRDKRDISNNVESENTVTYNVCVSISKKLTGMAIADITLLSGFEPVTNDLDRLKEPLEQYISHYEVSYGRVVLYFNNLFDTEECIEFDAIQTVPIGLLQPAPAVFYDYYEPNRKCTVFYSAPQRSKMVSKLCSGDVCQCAERPCHKEKDIFSPNTDQKIKRDEREQHACFSPTVDYAYIVEVVDVSKKSNFELYITNVSAVLRSHGDLVVSDKSIRVFAKRHQCKGNLVMGERYLMMGKDGATTDSNGAMQYLLESNTWVEKVPVEKKSVKELRGVSVLSITLILLRLPYPLFP